MPQYYQINNAINQANSLAGTPGLGYSSPGLPPFLPPGNSIYIMQDLSLITDANGGNGLIWDTSLPSVQCDINGALLVSPVSPGAVRGMTAPEIALASTVQSLQGAATATNLAKLQKQRVNLSGGATPTQVQQNAIDRILIDMTLSQFGVLDFLVTLNQSTQQVPHGTQKSNITVTWQAINGFPDVCAFFTDNTLPTGVTISAAPPVIGPLATAATLTTQVGAGVAAGVYPINLNWQSTPFTNQTTETTVLTLTVT